MLICEANRRRATLSNMMGDGVMILDILRCSEAFSCWGILGDLHFDELEHRRNIVKLGGAT